MPRSELNAFGLAEELNVGGVVVRSKLRRLHVAAAGRLVTQAEGGDVVDRLRDWPGAGTGQLRQQRAAADAGWILVPAGVRERS